MKNNKARIFILIAFILFFIASILNGPVFKKELYYLDVIPKYEQVHKYPIVFRGAYIDNKWVNPQEIVINKRNWLFNQADNTYSSNTEESLSLGVYFDNSLKLVFNTGPNYGSVFVAYKNNSNEIVLTSNSFNPYGNAFSIPIKKNEDDISEVFRNCAVQVFALCLFLIFICYCKKADILSYSSRCGSVELMRFVIAITICIYHYNIKLIPLSYLGVEFFFILSGFFLAKKAKTVLMHGLSFQDVFWRYLISIKKQYYKLVLWVLPCVLIAAYFTLSTGKGYKVNIFDLILELLCLDAFGFSFDRIIHQGWFISSLFLATVIVNLYLLKSYELFSHVISPVVSLFIYSFLLSEYGTLNLTLVDKTSIFISAGLLRGVAGLCFGVFVFTLYEKYVDLLDKYNMSDCSILSALMILFLFYVGDLNHICDSPDFFLLLVFSVVIVSCLSGHGRFNRMCQTSFFTLLGTISIPVYLLHQSFFKLGFANQIFNISTTVDMFVDIIMVVIISFLLQCVIRSYHGQSS